MPSNWMDKRQLSVCAWVTLLSAATYTLGFNVCLVDEQGISYSRVAKVTCIVKRRPLVGLRGEEEARIKGGDG